MAVTVNLTIILVNVCSEEKSQAVMITVASFLPSRHCHHAKTLL
jgi:hypothetical protein